MHFVEAKSILTSSAGYPGLNVYRGCAHGCIYCDSRSECYGMTHPFTDVEVKRNAPVLLERALRSRRKRCMIGTGSMSDPYMPCEEQLRLTRRCLEIIRKYGFGATVLTKSDRVLQDLELLEAIHRESRCVVQLTLTTDSAFEYVLLTDPKPAGFESADLTSGWTWNPVSMYREVRDADTNYFINRLPAGTVRVSYVLRPTVPGQFHAKPAQVQSLYNPEYGAHSAAEKVKVER